MAKMLAVSIPPISKELFDQLNSVFQPLLPEPDITTMDQLMHNAGSRAVIEWIRAHALRESTITGALADVSKSIDVRAG